MSSYHSSTYNKSTSPSDDDRKNYPLPVLIRGGGDCGGASCCNRRLTKMVMRKKQRIGIFNPATISTVLILYFISNQSITIIMSAGRNLTSNGDKHQVEDSNSSAASLGGSLVNLVAAYPSPEPAAAVARSASSGSHRSPPMNGSIFGKRSLNGNGHASRSRSEPEPNKGSPGQSQAPEKRDEPISHHTGVLDKEQQQKRQQQQPVPPSTDPNSPTTTTSSSSSSTSLDATSEATKYKDIITETIENFLSTNNESKFMTSLKSLASSTGLQGQSVSPNVLV